MSSFAETYAAAMMREAKKTGSNLDEILLVQFTPDWPQEKLEQLKADGYSPSRF